ncbi:MAG: putative quinol monooxygenase [Paracoccaceae bacterium]
MMRLRGQLRCLDEAQRAAVLGHRAEHSRLTRAEPGCLLFDIAETDDPLVFEVIEAFRTRDDFAAHQARTRDSRWFAATRAILRDFRVEEVAD